VLRAGESRLVPLCFRPTSACIFDGAVIVRSNDSDEPTVTVALSGRSLEGALKPGLALRGSIRAAGGTEEHCLLLEEGDRLLVRMSRASGEIQPAFCLYDPAGTRVECWSSSQPFEFVTPAQTGIYRVVIGERTDGAQTAPGEYGLYVQHLNNPVNATPLALGQPVDGTLEAAAEMDAFTFTGTAGDSIRLKLVRSSGTFRPSIRLYDPAGNYVGHSWQPQGAELEFTEVLPVNGRYTVLVDDGAEDATGGALLGGYTLSLSRR
jgi:hypothetical protein